MAPAPAPSPENVLPAYSPLTLKTTSSWPWLGHHAVDQYAEVTSEQDKVLDEEDEDETGPELIEELLWTAQVSLARAHSSDVQLLERMLISFLTIPRLT